MSLQTETILPAATETVQKVILRGVRWVTYERLLAEHQESSSTHFAYDRGVLEIMVLSPKHEALKHILALLVDILAEAFDIDVYGFGSTTVRHIDLERGFEPDACFYIQNEALVRGKTALDLTVDPPPDLVIEIDITSPSLDKFPIFAALGVGEVWRYDDERVLIFTLEASDYIERTDSVALPQVSAQALTDFVQAGQQLKRTLWLRRVRAWAQARITESD